MTTPFGSPAEFRVTSIVSTVVAQPAGAARNVTLLNQAPGSALSGENYIVRDGALELRPVLSPITASDNPFGARDPLSGAFELQTVNGIYYPTVLRHDTFAQPLGGGLGAAWSETAAVSNDTVLSGTAQLRWDTTQIYSDLEDQNVVVAAPDTRQALLYVLPGGSKFKVLTGAIGAKRVAAFDNYVLAGNVFDRSSALTFPQRIQWSDRGSASSWTGGLSGFEDLLAARGEIQRIIPLENRVMVFFDDEIWQGLPNQYPFTFTFSPLDRGIGCPYPWTATVTPQGVVFMGRDFQMYLLPKAGGQPQPIGQAIQRKVRSDITWPDRAFGVYDPNLQQYEMFYCASTDSYPRNAAFMDINSGAWSFQSFPVPLTTGCAVHERADRNNAVVPLVASSNGTIYRLSSEYAKDSLSVSSASVLAYWEFLPFGGETPAAQKLVTQVRVDYDAPSASSLTVRTSANQGETFSPGVRLSLGASSIVSQGVAYVNEASRYPVVRIEQESQRARIHRAHVTARVGGR